MKDSTLRKIGCLLPPGVMTAGWIVVLWLLLMLTGCTTTRYVPVETVRTEWRDREVERVVTDTVRDSRVVMVKGDTVVDVRERWHRSTVTVHDTVSVERTDTVSVPYPMEKQLSRWEQAKMDFGGVALGMIAAAVCVAVVWLARKFRK